MRIGMRNIKTAIAVFICVIVSKIFRFEYPFYVAIAAVIAMQSSVADSFKAGKNRMLGTFIGALIGLFMALIKPGNAFLIGIGIVIVIYLCNLLKWKDSISIACIVFAAIMLNLKEENPWLYSLNRLIDTFVGIGIAVLVNYFILPPEHIHKICLLCETLREKTAQIIKEKICLGNDIDLNILTKEISNLKKELDIYVIESKLKNDKAIKVEKVKEIIDIYDEIHGHLKVIYSIQGSYCLNDDNYSRLEDLYKLGISKNCYKNSEESIVFNYHVSKILDKLYYLDRFLYNSPA
jgi:uncharacterized membrane protein YgaE (UPF0421/DUF939 family)